LFFLPGCSCIFHASQPVKLSRRSLMYHHRGHSMHLFSLIVAGVFSCFVQPTIAWPASLPNWRAANAARSVPPAFPPTAGGGAVRQLLANTTFIENVHVRPTGGLLFSSVSTNSLYALDPTAAVPVPIIVANLINATGLTGIATLDDNGSTNLFAVGGGIHFSMGFVTGSCAVYVVSIPRNGNTGEVCDRIPVNGTINGLDSLPAFPWIVLVTDSVGGVIFRVNTRTRKVDVIVANPALLGPGGSAIPIGINGLKILSNYVYFTNSAQGFYGRMRIDIFGNKAGEIEILARSGINGRSNIYDDFAFDDAGNAYVSLHQYAFVKITPSGTQSLFYGSVGQYTTLYEPTAAAVSKKNKHLLYLAAGGITLNGTKHGGQLYEARI
jgi:hypothetical protein